MDQQAKYSEPQLLDLPGCDDNTWFSPILDVKKVKNKNNILGAPVSEKEMKIRSELEKEVERDLEEEIKDGIYNLSLRLHRLYQRQKERKEKEASEDDRNRACSEVNISIRMEGNTRVEIKESTKEATDKGLSRSRRSEDAKKVSGFGAKKLDWEKTLRVGSVNRENGSSKQRDKMGRNDHNLHSNPKFNKGRGKNDCCSRKPDRKVGNKPLQLGWRV